MAGVPEDQVITADAASAPSGSVQEPPMGAFMSAHVGAALESDAQDLYAVGMDSYLTSKKAQAVGQENALMEGVIDIRNQFLKLENGDAIQAYPKALNAAKELYNKSLNSIRSKKERIAFEENAMRNMRLVYESMGSHFDTQNKHYQQIQYVTDMKLKLREVETAARNPDKYSSAAVEGALDNAEYSAHRRGVTSGLDGDALKNFVESEMGQATDVAFKALIDRRASPDLIKSELDRYTKKNWVAPATQERVEKALPNIDAAHSATDILGGITPTNAIGIRDERGRRSPLAIDIALDKYVKAHNLSEDQREAIEGHIQKAVSVEKKQWQDRTGELALRVLAAAQSAGGFDLDLAGDDYGVLRQLAPDLRAKLEEQQSHRSNRASAAQKRDSVARDHDNRSRLYGMLLDPANAKELADMTPGSLLHFVGEKGLEFSDFGVAISAFKKIQEHQKQQKLDWIPKAVTQHLSGIYTASDEKQLTKTGKRYDDLVEALSDDFIAGKVANTPDAVNKWFKDKLTQVDGGGWFTPAQYKIDALERAAAPKQKAKPATSEEPIMEYDPVTKKWVAK